MKIFKDREHSLLIKPIGIKGKTYLVTTILIYFDLTAPETPLKEQELWQTIPDQLGQGVVLDQGMAKPRGEVVVTGSCFARRDERIPASEVSFRVGQLHKTLYIFGNRRWKHKNDLWNGLTEPESFNEMPIIYERAFGGEGFDHNPLGKGIHPVVMADGTSKVPLPNIEDPRHLIGASSDRPEPAGFGPIDLMWPQRMEKQGTYDEKWKNERWPWFPDDMNYEFFNIAPEDQFIEGHFAGNESIEIVNMHPDIPVIHSRLPGLRIRCFITKKGEMHGETPDNDLFQEAKTHIDTVWLFPSILRGVAMYRGTTEIHDEEFDDVRWIFIASEKMSDEPRSIEHYYEEQQRVLNRMVPIDPEPLERAKAAVADALKRVKNIPREIEDAKLRTVGKRPAMEHTPEETVTRSKEIIAGSRDLITKMETMVRDMQMKHGHLVTITSPPFDSIREKLTQTEQHLDDALANIKDAQKKADAVHTEVSDILKQNVSPEDLKKAGIDPDNLLKKKSVNPWHDKGFPLVIAWRKNLEGDEMTRKSLHDLGFSKRTIERAWFGVNHEERRDEYHLWGLEPEQDDRGCDKPLMLPAGFVIPHFADATLTRLRLRSGDVSGADGEVIVDGSDTTPLAVCADDGAPAVRTADELQAWLLIQEIGDACSVVALEDPGEKPDDETTRSLASAPVFLIVMSADEAADTAAWEAWKKTYPTAAKIVLPKGRTVFEARARGVDIREWIMEALPDEFARQHQVGLSMPEPGKPPSGSPVEGLVIPSFDVKDIVDRFMTDVKAFLQPKVDAALAVKSETEKKARDAILRAGKDPDTVLASAAKGGPPSFSKAGDRMVQTLMKNREQLRSHGLLTPEIETKLNATAEKITEMGRRGDQQYQEGMAKLASAQKEAEQAKSGGIPDSVKGRLAAGGVDVDKTKKLTREDVVERYEKGESLDGTILSEVDLSDLDLCGINLSSAQCMKTKFCRSNLDGATFSQTLAKDADFTGASLRNVKSEKGIFTKALFKGAKLNQSDFHSAILQEADLTDADMTKARLNMTVLQKARLTNTNLSNIDAAMCVFSEADASNALFAGASLVKCLFQKSKLDGADFSHAVLNSTMLFGAVGERVTFTGANLTKGRIGGNASLPQADFRNITMTHGCFREADLSGALFQGSVIQSSIIEKCDLHGADLYGISAKQTRFTKSNLEGADMRNVNLFFGSLRKARLVGANLSGGNLFGVDFYKAVLGKTKFDGANLKMSQLHNRVDLIE